MLRRSFDEAREKAGDRGEHAPREGHGRSDSWNHAGRLRHGADRAESTPSGGGGRLWESNQSEKPLGSGDELAEKIDFPHQEQYHEDDKHRPENAVEFHIYSRM